jgi:hypothetical protein
MFGNTKLWSANRSYAVAQRVLKQKINAKQIKEKRKINKKAQKVIDTIAKQINKKVENGEFNLAFEWKKWSPKRMGLHYKTWRKVASYVEPILEEAGYSVSTHWHNCLVLYNGRIGRLDIFWTQA